METANVDTVLKQDLLIEALEDELSVCYASEIFVENLHKTK